MDIFSGERRIGRNSPKRRRLGLEPVVDEGKVWKVSSQKSQQRSKETAEILLFFLRLLQQVFDGQLSKKLRRVGFGLFMVR